MATESCNTSIAVVAFRRMDIPLLLPRARSTAETIRQVNMLTTRFAHPVACRRLVSREAAAQLVEYGEILVSDARASLTIAQLVDDKVLAMLGSGANFRPVSVRRT